MSVCSRCENSYTEYELTWIKITSKQPIQITWTGRGRDPRKEEEKMELVCDDCLKKETTSSSSLSS
jgi:hypothetical protein